MVVVAVRIPLARRIATRTESARAVFACALEATVVCHAQIVSASTNIHPHLSTKEKNMTKCVRTAPPLLFQIPISPVGFVANAASPNLIIDPNVAFSLYASAPRSVGSYSIDVTWMIYPAPRPLLPAKSASQCNRYCA